MRRSRAARPTPSMSLFPFLAVLICTMGVLIVLLVLVTREANMQAEAKAQEQAEDRDLREQKLQEELDRESFRSSMLADLQPGLQERLNDARLRRSHLEDQIRELEAQADKLQTQIAAFIQQPSDDSLIESQQQLADLKQQIEQAELELQSAQELVQHRQRSYAVVPYPGPNGTTRRPIYLECSSEGIRMQPHDIVFTSRELHKPVLAGNPLDAALLAVREYWAKYGLENEEPYPLLIVRPDGAAAYAMAREAMKSWDSEFGYELVDSGITLEFPGEDPELERHLRDVVQAAYEKQEHLQSALVYRERMKAISNGRNGSGGLNRRTNGSDSSGGFGQGDEYNGGEGNSSDEGLTLRATHRRGGFVVEREGDGGQSSSFNPTNSNSAGETAIGDVGWEIDPSGNVRLRDRSLDSQAGNRSPGQLGGSEFSSNTNYDSPSPRGQRDGDRLALNEATNDSSGFEGQGSERSQGRQPTNSTSFGNQSQQGLQGNSSAASQSSESMNLASLAQSRGNGWALPSKSPRAIAYRKPIQLSCSRDRLTIYPGAYSTEPIRHVDLNDATEEHLDELVDGIWRLIDSWGSAGYNAYWKPELHVRVAAEGEQRFRELQALMQGSGIVIKRKAE